MYLFTLATVMLAVGKTVHTTGIRQTYKYNICESTIEHTYQFEHHSIV